MLAYRTWHIPLFTNSKVGSASGMTLDDGTNVCPFSLTKKSMKVLRTRVAVQSIGADEVDAILATDLCAKRLISAGCSDGDTKLRGSRVYPGVRSRTWQVLVARIV